MLLQWVLNMFINLTAEVNALLAH